MATDYDGTLAHNGRVSETTVKSLEALLATGRRLLLVTGRELPELLEIFPQVDLFEWVVAENGGLLYQPSKKLEKALAYPPSPQFLEALRPADRAAVGRASDRRYLGTLRASGAGDDSPPGVGLASHLQ